MKKVCMLTSRHSPLDARVFHKEALSLHRNNYSISIVAPVSKTGFFLDSGENEILRTDDRLSLIYNDIKFQGFKIKKSRIPKLCFFINIKRNVDAITKAGFNEGADIYHCHEFDALIAGVKIKKMLNAIGKQCYLIYDAHEYWPGAYEQRFQQLPLIGKFVKNWISNIEHKMIKNCDFILTANQIVRSYFLLMNRFVKTEIIYNCPILELFKDEPTKYKDEYRILCHEGSLKFDRGLKTMIEVIRRLLQSSMKVKLLIVGDVYGEEQKWLSAKTIKYQLHNNIEKTGWLPYNEVGRNVARGNIGIIFMEPLVNNMLGGLPNKLFNYMRYGLPVLAPDFPEFRRIILDNKCGLLVNTLNIDEVCSAIKYLFNNPIIARQMGENGRMTIMTKYNWGLMEKKLLRVYQEIQREK